MGSKELKTRDQIDSRYKWNIEAMMPDEGIIDGELEKIKDTARAYTERFSGHLADSGETLLAAFEEKDSIWRRLEKIYVYAHMKRDEDNGSSKYQGMTDKAVSVIAAVGAAEAEAIDKKAEAQKKMGEASIVELVMEALPKITANAAAPLTNVDKIVMYGEGGSTKMIKDVMNSTNQILEGVKEATGIDITNIVSSYMGSSAAINSKD